MKRLYSVLIALSFTGIVLSAQVSYTSATAPAPNVSGAGCRAGTYALADRSGCEPGGFGSSGTVFSLKNGINVWSDSIGHGTGLPPGLGWGPQLAAALGTVITSNAAYGGTVIADTAFFTLGWQTSSQPMPGDHNNPINFMEIGTNSANGNNSPAVSTLLGEEQSAVAAGLVLGTSGNDKYWFANTTQFTTTGSWTAIDPFLDTYIWPVTQSGYTVGDVLTILQTGSCNCATIVVDTVNPSSTPAKAITAYHFTNYGTGYSHGIATSSGGTGTGFHLTYYFFCAACSAMQSSTAGNNILSGPIYVGPNGAAGIVFGTYPSNGASFQVFLDGSATPLTDVVSGSSTLSSNYLGHGRIGGRDTGFLSPIAAVFRGISQGAHTFKVQSTTSGLFTPIFLTTPKSYSGGDGPNLILSNVMPEQGNAFNVSSCKLSNSHSQAAAILNSIGMKNVLYVDIAGWSDKMCGSSTYPTNLDTNLDFASTFTVAAHISNCAVASSGIATLTATNTFSAGSQIFITGLTACHAINSTANNGYTVLPSGLSGSQFQIKTALTSTIASIADSGTAALMLNNVVLNTAPPLHPSSSGQSKIVAGFARAAQLQPRVE